MSTRARNWWGWGFADARPDAAALGPTVRAMLGFGADALREPVDLDDIRLPERRLDGPYTHNPHARLQHALGKSFPDTVRAFTGEVPYAPDLVATPHDEAELEAALEWADGANAAVIPYGGGTSVVGGVEPRDIPARFDGVLSVDLSRMDRVLEVDEVSLAARIQAGAAGPVLERQLGAHGLTMRFFPQSFELSTLGGWIATRAGGHFATVLTHVDDLVESIRACTPAGWWESRRLPGSGAGPSPDRMLLGSEGTLGVITEAWVRVRPRPRERASRAVRFADGFLAGAACVRALAQSGLNPANCRLVDAAEARQTGAGDGSHAVLVLGFESAEEPVGGLLDAALRICRAHGGEWDEPSGDGGAVGAWREAFLAMPYLRDTLLQWGVLTDTFETAITWERFDGFVETVMAATREALGEPCRVTCRLTHVYPDGAAPYFTVLAPAAPGEELARWTVMKEAASDAIIAAGGTITHHHAVGRDHRPWYTRQRPDVFAAALAGAKAAVDPAGRLNPGVLLQPMGS